MLLRMYSCCCRRLTYSGDYQSHCLLLGAIEERYELHIYLQDVQSLAEIKNVQTKDQRYYLH